MITHRDHLMLDFISLHGAITVKQAARLFYEGEWAYDQCRKRLVSLLDKGIVKRYKTKNDEYIYYREDKNKPLEKGKSPMSEHDIYIYDFYSMLVHNGCKITYFKYEPRYLNQILRPDALFRFDYKSKGTVYEFNILLEVDYWHKTGEDRLAKYDEFFASKEFNTLYGENPNDPEPLFPYIVVMTTTPVIHKADYKIINIDFKMNDFKEVVLDVIAG